jgi:hypothetical protein
MYQVPLLNGPDCRASVTLVTDVPRTNVLGIADGDLRPPQLITDSGWIPLRLKGAGRDKVYFSSNVLRCQGKFVNWDVELSGKDVCRDLRSWHRRGEDTLAEREVVVKWLYHPRMSLETPVY